MIRIVAALALLASASELGLAAEQGPLLKGEQAVGGWRQDKPGVRRLLTPSDLPPVGNETPALSAVVPNPAGAMPQVPAGFSVEMVASGMNIPRVIRTAPNGDLFVAESGANQVRVLRLASGSGTPARNEVFASGLHQPYGIAFYPSGPNPEWLYVANSYGVVRFPYRNGDLTARGKAENVIEHIAWTHHWTRDIAFTPDGKRLLLTVGSGSNIALDMFPAPRVAGGLEGWHKSHPPGAAWDSEDRRANLLSYGPDGKDEKIFATGLRNCSGLTIRPETGQPWCVVNERDGLGNDTPFEYATEVKKDAFYGWPWYYIGSNEDPRHKGARPDLRGQVTVPDVLMQAHSAPLQIVFYEGNAFPASYKGSAFVTFHGSWDRSPRTGYKVVRLLFDKNGRPTGEYEDFMTGFVVSDTQVWGRPVGVAVAQDGSLFVTEDGNGTIWRVSYKGTLAN
ncbi:MAG: PQQ-dependent sugar dehydrogenase [Steroidobacteraceae bacterium]